MKLDIERRAEVETLLQTIDDDPETTLFTLVWEKYDAKDKLEALQAAVLQLPDVVLDDISATAIPTARLIELIRNCRKIAQT